MIANELEQIENGYKDLYIKISILEIEKEKLRRQIRNLYLKQSDIKVIT